MSPLGQSQEASEGAVALQAARDVNVTVGPSVTEVRMLVDSFVQAHLPALQQAARDEAQRNVEKFLSEFVGQLGKTSRVSAKEFAKPDAQSTFNEALRGCALKGEDADVALVSRVLIERLAASDKPLLKLVCESAIRVLPTLTKPQIAYLALIQYTKSVKHNSLTSTQDLEVIFQRILPLVEAGFRLSPANRQYLASSGLVTLNPVANANLYPGELRQNYPFLPTTDEKIRLEGGLSILKIMEEYATVQGPMAFLTSTGQLVGMQHLASTLGTVNMEIWIN
jgi:hypothetical protein